MSSGMHGADTDLLRDLAREFRAQGDAAWSAAITSKAAVDGVDWDGDDAVWFRLEYDAAVVTDLRGLTALLASRCDELLRQADEQDRASAAEIPASSTAATTATDAGGESHSSSRLGSPSDWPWLDWYSDLRSPLRIPKFLLEATYAARNPGAFGSFLTRSWQGILRVEDGVKNWSPVTRWLYRLLDWAQFKTPSVWLEKLLDGATSRVPGVNIESWLNGRFGKPGRLFSRGVGAFGLYFDMNEFVDLVQAGDYRAAFGPGLKSLLGMASFVPGPIGWGSAGISVVWAGYDNIPAVRTAIEATGDVVVDAASWTWDIVGDGWGVVTDVAGDIDDTATGWINSSNDWALEQLNRGGDVLEDGVDFVKDLWPWP